MSKYRKGDRVRVLEFAGRTIGVTGITGTVTESNEWYEGANVQLDRAILGINTVYFSNIRNATFYDYEMEYENNRKGAAVGDLIASVGDIVYCKIIGSCDAKENHFFILDKTYFEGDAWVGIRCPDCNETMQVARHEVANFCYKNEFPQQEIYYERNFTSA